MREFIFTDDVLTEIRHDRYQHPHPRVQRKMEVLWLKSQGLTHESIATLADMSLRSARRCLDEYLDGGLGRVRQLNWKGRPGELDEHQESLEYHFLTNPPHSVREARAVIEKQTGIRRGLTQVREFLKKKNRSSLAKSGNRAGQGGPGEAGRIPQE